MLAAPKLEIVTIPALEDNYYFLVHDPSTQRTAVVDVGAAAPIVEALDARGWTLDEIWITHHHWDHTDGLPELSAATNAPITGAQADAHRLPPLARALSPGDQFEFAGHTVEILPADGHTLGHIAFYIPSAQALFCADSLMALGCGRLAEGTAAQMFSTFAGFAALPDNTNVYSGHEYAEVNAAFALTVDPTNNALHTRRQDIIEKRALNQPSVPSLMALEKATNPYFRAHTAEVKAALKMAEYSDLDVFAELRRRKDRF